MDAFGNSLRLLAPEWLFLWAAIPLVFSWLLWRRKEARAAFSAWISPQLALQAPAASSLLSFYSPPSSLQKAVLRLLAFFWMVLALAQPQWGFREEKYRMVGSDLFLVLDLSLSMETEDVPPSRIQKTKHWLRSLLPEIRGQRVGLVSFAGAADLTVPLTTDLAYLDEKLSEASPSQFLAQGTDIGLALDMALAALQRGSESEADPSDSQSHQAILLISDGEDQEQAALQAAQRIQKQGIRFLVIGVGTEKGGPIPVKDTQGNPVGFKRSSSGELVLSQFRSDFLMQLAKAGEGRFWKASLEQAEIEEVIRELGLLEAKLGEEKVKRVYQEWFQLPLFLAFLFLILELFWSRRSLKAASAVALLAVLGGFASLAAMPRPLWALAGRAPLGAYQKNQEGITKAQEGDWKEAEQNFNAAQALSPERPELEFNRGVTQFEQKKGKEAIRSFENALGLAEATQNARAAATSAFNLGKAFEQEGKRREATAAYQKAIAWAQKLGDAELEKKARKNIELLPGQKPPEPKQDQKPQKDKEKNKDKKQDQSKGDSKDKAKEGESEGEGEGKDVGGDKKSQEKSDPSDPKDRKDKKDENGQDSKPDATKEPEKTEQSPEKASESQPEKGEKSDEKSAEQSNSSRDFKSEKLSPEDAEQVLSDLVEKEKELHQRLQRRGKSVKTNAKDW